jgi:prolyl-tRNA synthetase
MSEPGGDSEGSKRQPRGGKGKAPKEAKGGKPQAKSAAQNADVTFASSKEQFSDWFEELMVTAGIVDKHWDVKGMPIFLPYGYYMHLAIMKLFEREYGQLGIRQCQFPAFIPRSFLEREADHVKGFQSECFWHEDKMCLRPTSETAMYSMFHMWVNSIEDLPCMVHQTCQVYRYETKSTKPLIRVREIPWNEAHTAHATREEAIGLLDECWRIVHVNLTEKLSIDGLRLRRPDWDRFPGAEYTDVLDVVMPCGRVLQTVGAHYLGQHFSKVFDIGHAVDNECAYMTCIGVSTRVLAAVLSMHGDDKGLILPSEIAPYQIIIVPILNKKTEDAMNHKIEEMRAQLSAAGIRVRVDSNQQKRPGEKYFYYEMKGVPMRIEFGMRDLDKGECVVAVRGIEGKQTIKLDELVPRCQEALVAYDVALRERAQAHLQSRIVDCGSLEEISGVLEKGGFARIPYHTMGREGAEGAEKIHEQCGGEIRGYRPLEEQPSAGETCIVTGQPAKYWAYVARAY